VPKKEETTVATKLADKGRILVMDDEEIIRHMLSSMLNLDGYEVETSSDGAEAIKRYSKALEVGQPFDAITMDLIIPGGMGGKEAVAELIEIDPEVKIIVSSGDSTDLIMPEYKKYGFSAAVTKPYGVEDIEKILHSLLRKK